MAFDLEAEVRDLAARRDINDCVQRYMRGLDRLDFDMVLSAFHADARVDCGIMQGDPRAFADFARSFLEVMDATHHLLGQVRIELEGERALGECYFQAWHRVLAEDGAVRDLFISGRYVDEYACRDGQWRIASRTLVTDWSTDAPGTLDFFTANPNAPRGARSGADLTQTRKQLAPAN